MDISIIGLSVVFSLIIVIVIVYYIERKPKDGYVINNKVKDLVRRHKFKKAIRIINKVLSNRNIIFNNSDWLTNSLLTLKGDSYYGQLMFVDAIDCYSDVLKNGADSFIYFKRGLAKYFAKGNWKYLNDWKKFSEYARNEAFSAYRNLYLNKFRDASNLEFFEVYYKEINSIYCEPIYFLQELAKKNSKVEDLINLIIEDFNVFSDEKQIEKKYKILIQNVNTNYITEINKKRDPKLPETRIKEIKNQNHDILFVNYETFSIDGGKYPIVKMPTIGCAIKNPLEGRSGKIGKSELVFFNTLSGITKNNPEIFKNKVLRCKNNIVYEPDITITIEKINLYIDIEIDEPYEGINNISARKPTHYINLDINRDNAFTNRGWIVIRFSEEQIVKQPYECCHFILNTIQKIYPSYVIPLALNQIGFPDEIKQWSYNEALNMSNNRIREKYLEVEGFGTVLENLEKSLPQPNNHEIELEDQIHDTPIYDTRDGLKKELIIKKKYLKIINSAIKEHKYLKIKIKGEEQDIYKPMRFNETDFSAYSYTLNSERYLYISDIEKIEILDTRFLNRISNDVTIEKLIRFFKERLNSGSLLRMEYTSYSDSGGRYIWLPTDEGEFEKIQNQGKTTIRTIKSYNFDTEYNSDETNYYIKSYCFNRENERTFKLTRINWIEELDLVHDKAIIEDDDLPF